MDNPFKKIQEPLQDAPPRLKKKILKDIAILMLIKDVSTLFTVNLSSVLEKSVIKKINNNHKKPINHESN